MAYDVPEAGLRLWYGVNLFPAHAGVIPEKLSRVLERQSLPRACGGDPARIEAYIESVGSSPRVRG